MRTNMQVLGVVLVLVLSGTWGLRNKTQQLGRDGKMFSLFSIVQFPNQVCTSASSSTTYGTCYTASECTTKSGTADGNCAAGFGVCCVISTSTCSSTISTNTTYIQNPGYPSSYTPTATGSCVFTVSKASDDICQLRLDFQTMSGLATSTTVGMCTDSFAAAGQTGKNPPTICGTNTGYHMYTEFGATSTDTISLTVTYGSTTTAKTFNILTRQISCTAAWKAPTDCTQYFTGTAGSVQSYNFAGGQLLNSQYYSNCIRTESGYCGIQWKESSTTSPDPFQMTKNPVTNGQAGHPTACTASFIYIPNLSPDGIAPLPVPDATQEFYSTMCGGAFAIDGKAIPLALVSRTKPFVLGVFTDTTTALTAPTTGFNMDYTQTAC
eukprot:TRINITY_DN43201_c0_g1_i1.p1 TRINITY_DN43201_c0_g1~~TRINITY_DN43201_c0_g1_i1.p1  ORF type:complete len:380 (-),score=76.16 TRINITY_DN43201_c0_g1_i1:263-1402(-)